MIETLPLQVSVRGLAFQAPHRCCPSLCAITTSAFAFGDSLALTSSGNGKFDYEYLPSPSLGEAYFQDGDTISLTGLSGVTDATMFWPEASFFTLSYTSSSVTITRTGGSLLNVGGPFSLLELSSLAPLGTVDYTIEAVGQYSSGLVGGPVAPADTPEPGTFMLLGSGALGLAGVIRKKLNLQFLR
jgi:hypothetical protein